MSAQERPQDDSVPPEGVSSNAIEFPDGDLTAPSEPVSDPDLLTHLRETDAKQLGHTTVASSVETRDFTVPPPILLWDNVLQRCESEKVEIATTDRRELKVLVEITRQAIWDTANHRVKASLRPQRSRELVTLNQTVVRGHIDTFFKEFFKDSGVTPKNDEVIATRRETYLEIYGQHADNNKNKCPEIQYAQRLAEHLAEQGYDIAVEAVIILLAAYGKRFEGITYAARNIRRPTPANSGPLGLGRKLPHLPHA